MSATASGPDPARVAELFDLATDRSPEERDAFLDEACGADIALKQEVIDLLRFDPAEAPSKRRQIFEPHGLALTRPEAPGARKKNAASPELDATVRADGRTRPSPVAKVGSRETEPASIGRFEVTGKLGEGGMGVVYSGVDNTLDRKVALKLVKPERARSGRARMLREAQAMARVAHPNVVPIYEAGIHGDGVFIAMELVPGETLRSWLDAEPRGWRAILQRFVEAGRGLAAAHRAGVLHRDFKPENVLLGDDGRARVLDFGLARAASGDGDEASRDEAAGQTPFAAELTHPGAIMGTPGFMSPEHFEGPLGPWSDQWSFAVALYRALYGALPFLGDTLDELRDHVLSGEIQHPPPSDVPAETAEVIQRGMQRFPADRFPSLDEMVDALELPLRTDPDFDPSISRASRHRTALAVAAVGIVSFVLLSIRTRFRYDIGMQGITIQLFVGTAIMVAAMLALRRELAKNTHNRRVVIFFVLQLIALNADRLYALARGLEVVDVLRVEAIFVAALDGLAAVAIESWFGWPAAAFVIYFALSLVFPRITTPGFGICIISSVALGIWFWREPRMLRGSKGTRSSSGRSDPNAPSPKA